MLVVTAASIRAAARRRRTTSRATQSPRRMSPRAGRRRSSTRDTRSASTCMWGTRSTARSRRLTRAGRVRRVQPGQSIPAWDLTTVYHRSAERCGSHRGGAGCERRRWVREQRVHDRVRERVLPEPDDDSGLTSSLESLLDVVPPELVPVDSSPPTISGVATEAKR